MAKVKVINKGLNQNLNGGYFNDTPSNTIFSFGKFFVTTNFDNKVTIDYSNSLSSFVRPVTLETMGVSDKQSEIIEKYTTNAVLNLDKSDLNTFVRYGSAYEFIRNSIQNIILAYPGSLFINSQIDFSGSSTTFSNLNYDIISNTSIFTIPTDNIVNTFGLVYNDGNTSVPDDNELKNLNNLYDKYVIWSKLEPNNFFKVIGYTGNTADSSDLSKSRFLTLKVEGNPFKTLTSGSTGSVNYHIRPNNEQFEEFRALLSSYEQNIVSNRITGSSNGFSFKLKNPTLLENGKILYNDSNFIWITSDGYNIDINTSAYQLFLESILTVAAKYDKVKTDLIARFLTPSSLKVYDITEEGKISKLLRVYGAEFDQLRQFIDSLVNINKVTYDKLNNVPDQIIKNMANTFGWDYFSLVNETELMESFLTVDDTERNLNDNILPAEIDVELWRRILNNTSYFWKTKGTREAIKSMFLLIGIPEPFINITEYVYTVDGKINPNTVPLTKEDFPSNSLPYDTEGYPIAPLETDDFYFQISGDTDAGQAYLDVFRQAGFNLKQTPDNKKSWIQTGSTTRIHHTTPQYYQEDSRLVINTKEVDIALDTARGIEFDVYEYIQKDFLANSSGYTLPYSYVNISSIPNAGNTFTLPFNVDEIQGDFEVRYNGILLNAPSISGNSSSTRADYSVSGNQFTIPELSGGMNSTDVIEATLIATGQTSGIAVSGISVNYIVTRVNAKLNGTYVPLPSYPRGDIQLTINGIALTKGTGQFTADYILDPANSSGGTNQVIIQNPDVIAFLNENPEVQISYVEVQGSNDINLRSEVIRVDSFNTNKIYFNSSANKYVYKLNYKINNASEVKLLINGIALEPNKDYSINSQNPYEIFLPRGIRYGTVISAYYLVGGAGAFNPVINDVFGLGDISKLSFLEFLELVERKMVNVRNRKTITNFKGGWYPTILKLYETYLERALLPNNNPLQSNGYTFQNLYPFLSKYNAFFQRFIDQLLSATIIMKRSGLLIRNSIFTKQKHWYKRGVNVASGTTNFDMRGNALHQYFGDDGSTFEIIQDAYVPPPPVFTISTCVADWTDWSSSEYGASIGGLGGYDAFDLNCSRRYGVETRFYSGGTWSEWIPSASRTGPIDATRFEFGTQSGFCPNTDYQYRAYIETCYIPNIGDNLHVTGNTLSITTAGPPPPPPTPSVDTLEGIAGIGTLEQVGGYNIVRYEDVQYTSIEYKKSTDTTWITYSKNNGPLSVNNFATTIPNLDENTSYDYRARIVVDGIAYTGDIETLTTLSQPAVSPTVTTGQGLATIAFPYQILVKNNTLVSSGNSSTIEYGTLYSQRSDVIKDNLGVLRISNLGDISDGTTWDDTIGGTLNLRPNTTYYYRAYATNSIGTSCGVVRNIKTGGLNPPPTGYDITLDVVWNDTTWYSSDDGLAGYIQLTCNNQPTIAQQLTRCAKVQSVTFHADDESATYGVDLNYIDAYKNGNLNVAQYCWYCQGSTSSCYYPIITNITEASSYCVKVKTGRV